MVEDFQDAKNDVVIALVFKRRKVSRKWHSYGSEGVKGYAIYRKMICTGEKWCLTRIGLVPVLYIVILYL